MATNDWQKGLAQKVILDFAERGIAHYDEHEYTETARRIAKKEGAVYGSVSMHVRMAKPLVKNGFERKIEKAKRGMAESKPFTITPLMRCEMENHVRFLESTLPERDRD